jgi:hypothetical protein
MMRLAAFVWPKSSPLADPGDEIELEEADEVPIESVLPGIPSGSSPKTLRVK